MENYWKESKRYYFKAWENYANFKGRATKKEYSRFIILQLIIISLIVGFANIAKTYIVMLYGLGLLYILASFLPILSITVRRLHDTGKSGWWVLVSLIPYIGSFIVFIMCISLPSQEKDNKWGTYSKGKDENIERNRKKELIESSNKSKQKLDSYIEELKFRLIEPIHITGIANLIHTFICHNYLLNNEISGSFESAKNILEQTQFEQVKVINNLKNYLNGKILGLNWTLEELNDVKEDSLKLASKEMNEIFTNSSSK